MRYFQRNKDILAADDILTMMTSTSATCCGRKPIQQIETNNHFQDIASYSR
jgi:hypothetical protein